MTAARDVEPPVAGDALRVLVADDSAPFRAGLAALAASVDGIELVGEATDGDSAIAAALESALCRPIGR
jgi:DNA-binding NarL/FixJ family response regulator